MKIPALILLASTSSIIGSDADRAFLLSLAGIIALVAYRVLRKFKKEVIKTWKAWFDQNIVKCLLATVIAPGAIRVTLQLIKEIVGKL